MSHWTRVEFASLLAREVRMGGLDTAVARRGANVIYSLDRRMIAAGKKLGLPTDAGISLPGHGD